MESLITIAQVVAVHPLLCIILQISPKLFKEDLVNHPILVILHGRGPFIQYVPQVMHQDVWPLFFTCFMGSKG